MAEHERETRGGIDLEIDARGIVRVGAWLAVITVVGFVVSWFFYLYLLRGEQRLDAPPSPIAEARAQRPARGPGLQQTPERDLAALERAARTQLHGWAWVDREAGVARVPIDVALERVAAAGALPDFTAPAEGEAP